MTTAPPARQFDILLTAQEAFPAFEREVLNARRSIIAGFRIFDPWTTLQSDEARKVGDTWFDLIVATLNRGVQITLYISDFDPVARIELHRYCWANMRGLCAAAEASNRPDLLQVHPVLHPARVGILVRTLLWPRTSKEVRKTIESISEDSIPQQQKFLAEAPHFRELIRLHGNALRPRAFPPRLVPASHHQKLAVFDEERLYVGGLDLNNRRYDTPEHGRSASETWHDTQVIVDGPVAKEAADHLRSFQSVTSGQRRPDPSRYLLRTLSVRRFSMPFLSPRPLVTELAQAHLSHTAASDTLIYLETQYFRDKAFAKALARRARKAPDLSLILIVPAAPDDIAFEDNTGSDAAFGEHLQAKCVDIVRRAFGRRVFIGSPAQQRIAHTDGRATHFGAPIVYLHAKVSIFDDAVGIVSSANLNGRSFRWDTEAGVATQHKSEVRALKTRCFAHWLGDGADPACFETATACQAWAELALENTARAPERRQGFILPYRVAPAKALGHDLPGVPEEMV